MASRRPTAQVAASPTAAAAADAAVIAAQPPSGGGPPRRASATVASTAAAAAAAAAAAPVAGSWPPRHTGGGSRRPLRPGGWGWGAPRARAPHHHRPPDDGDSNDSGGCGSGAAGGGGWGGSRVAAHALARRPPTAVPGGSTAGPPPWRARLAGRPPAAATLSAATDSRATVAADRCRRRGMGSPPLGGLWAWLPSGMSPATMDGDLEGGCGGLVGGAPPRPAAARPPLPGIRPPPSSRTAWRLLGVLLLAVVGLGAFTAGVLRAGGVGAAATAARAAAAAHRQGGSGGRGGAGVFPPPPSTPMSAPPPGGIVEPPPSAAAVSASSTHTCVVGGRCYPAYLVYDATYGQLNNQVVSFLNAAALAAALNATLVVPPAVGGRESCVDAYLSATRAAAAAKAAAEAAAVAAAEAAPAAGHEGLEGPGQATSDGAGGVIAESLRQGRVAAEHHPHRWVASWRSWRLANVTAAATTAVNAYSWWSGRPGAVVAPVHAHPAAAATPLHRLHPVVRQTCGSSQPPLVGARGYFSAPVLSHAVRLATTSTAAFGASPVGVAFATADMVVLPPGGTHHGRGLLIHAPHATFVRATPPPPPSLSSRRTPAAVAAAAASVLPLTCESAMWAPAVAPWVRSWVPLGPGAVPNGGVLAVDHAYNGGAVWRGACGRVPLYGYLAPTPRLVDAAVTLLAAGVAAANAAHSADDATHATATLSVGSTATGVADRATVGLRARRRPPTSELTVGKGVVAVHVRILADEERGLPLTAVVATTIAAVEAAVVHHYTGTAAAAGHDPAAGVYGQWPGGVAAVRGERLLASAAAVYVAFSPSSVASTATAVALRDKYGAKVFWFNREVALGGAAAAAAADAADAADAVASAAADAVDAEADSSAGFGQRRHRPDAGNPLDWLYGPSVVDMWASVLADHFIGRDSSSFSGNIEQWRRGELRSELRGKGGAVRRWVKENTESLQYHLQLDRRRRRV